MITVLRQLWNDESGQGLTEEALLTDAVATEIIGLAAVFRQELASALNATGKHITDRAQEMT